MCDGTQKVLEAQTEIGRRLRGGKDSLKVVASKAGWHINTLNSYFPPSANIKPTKLPSGALFDLIQTQALPSELLALLLPDGWLVVRVPDGVDHDEAALAMHDYLATKTAAHDPASPAGRDLSDCEKDTLDGKLAVVKA